MKSADINGGDPELSEAMRRLNRSHKFNMVAFWILSSIFLVYFFGKDRTPEALRVWLWRIFWIGLAASLIWGLLQRHWVERAER